MYRYIASVCVCICLYWQMQFRNFRSLSSRQSDLVFFWLVTNLMWPFLDDINDMGQLDKIFVYYFKIT